MKQARHSFLAAAIIVGAIGSVTAWAKWTSRRDPVGGFIYEIAHTLTPGKSRAAAKPAMKPSVRKSSSAGNKGSARSSPMRRAGGGKSGSSGSEARVITNDQAQRVGSVRGGARFNEMPKFVGPRESVGVSMPRVSVPVRPSGQPQRLKPIPPAPAPTEGGASETSS